MQPGRRGHLFHGGARQGLEDVQRPAGIAHRLHQPRLDQAGLQLLLGRNILVQRIGDRSAGAGEVAELQGGKGVGAGEARAPHRGIEVEGRAAVGELLASVGPFAGLGGDQPAP